MRPSHNRCTCREHAEHPPPPNFRKAPSDTNFRVGRPAPNTAPKQTAPLPAKWQRSAPVGQHSCKKKLCISTPFRCTVNIFNSSKSASKTFFSDQGRASFLCESKQKKIEKKTCSYPVPPQFITRRFRLTPRSAKRPGPFGFTTSIATYTLFRCTKNKEDPSETRVNRRKI